MLKNFKHILIVTLATVIHFETVAQTTIYKDVLLDGKPAKLNTVTGEVKLLSELTNSIVSDSLDSKLTVKSLKDTNQVEREVTKTPTQQVTSLVYEIEPPSQPIGKTDYHTVQKGETLYGLSRRYGATLAELKRANNLETTLIKTGQVLRVQNFDDLYDSDTWLVVKGDTLYNIAKRTNTTVSDLKALNNLTSSLIKIGQVLRLK